MKKVTRREFIIDSTKVTKGAVGAVTYGRTVLLPDRALAAKEKFLGTSCGFEKANGNRALVAYATNSESTG